jgi:hypothetical protein
MTFLSIAVPLLRYRLCTCFDCICFCDLLFTDLKTMSGGPKAVPLPASGGGGFFAEFQDRIVARDPNTIGILVAALLGLLTLVLFLLWTRRRIFGRGEPRIDSSVADPGCFPGSEFFPPRIRIQEFKYFNPKNCF